MKRVLISLAVLLSVLGVGALGTHIGTTSLTFPQPIGVDHAQAASFWANTPGWAPNGWEQASASIGGYGAGRQYQVCIQDSYGFTFSCSTGYTINNNLNRYYSLAQAYTCLPSRSWAWLSGVGVKVSGYVDLC